METPASIPTPTAPQPTTPMSFWKKHAFTLVTIGILIVALIPLIVLSQRAKPQPSSISNNTTLPSTTPTPTVVITQQNAQPTLDQAAQNIQDAINSSQADLNAVSQIDTSQDSTSGL